MQITRKITITDRVFTIQDLRRFAKILDELASNDRESSVNYEVKFDDDLSFEGKSDEVFAEEELNRPSRPRRIEMRLRSYPDYVSIELSAGDNNGIGNAIVVCGSAVNWVNSTHGALNDALQKVQPQAMWWKKHSTFFWCLIALGLFSLFELLQQVLAVLVRIGSQGTPHLAAKASSATSFWSFLSSNWWWILPALYLAFLIRGYILSAWPDIEFNFGSIYLRPDKRRQRLNTVVMLAIIPIVINAIYDLLKLAFI